MLPLKILNNNTAIPLAKHSTAHAHTLTHTRMVGARIHDDVFLNLSNTCAAAGQWSGDYGRNLSNGFGAPSACETCVKPLIVD